MGVYSMNNKENEISYSFRLSFLGLIRWSLLRHKYLLPAFIAIQVIVALAIVYGFALMVPNIDDELSLYMSSGALTLGIIAVGCVLAPQIISESKQNGIFSYQRTLPVSRNAILIADVIIWGIAGIPGIIMSCFAGILRFDININITVLGVCVVIFALISMILIGFSLAYMLTPSAMTLCTQIIMIVGLLFSPITYPAERLPEWALTIHEFLPFVPVSNLIRSTLFNLEEFRIWDIIVVLIWGIIAYIISLKKLSQKE